MTFNIPSIISSSYLHPSLRVDASQDTAPNQHDIQREAVAFRFKLQTCRYEHLTNIKSCIRINRPHCEDLFRQMIKRVGTCARLQQGQIPVDSFHDRARGGLTGDCIAVAQHRRQKESKGSRDAHKRSLLPPGRLTGRGVRQLLPRERKERHQHVRYDPRSPRQRDRQGPHHRQAHQPWKPGRHWRRDTASPDWFQGMPQSRPGDRRHHRRSFNPTEGLRSHARPGQSPRARSTSGGNYRHS
eukprot:scaffold1405_cov29-Prasinocladus_malaysianus.AAC.1